MSKGFRDCAKAPGQKKGSKWNSPDLKKMRDAAFGPGMTKFIRDVCGRSERGRDDQALLDAAQKKRERKAAKGKGTVREDTDYVG